MTHTEVVHYLAENLQMTQKDVRELLGECIDTFKEYLDDEKDVYIPGLGIFHSAHRDERKGFHPIKKRFMMLPHRRVVTFHASSTLKDRFRNGRTQS